MNTSPMITLLLSLLLSITVPTHEYHVSKTNLRFVPDKQEVQIEMHVFVDDLEKDMHSYGAPRGLEIGTDRENHLADQFLIRYLRENFIIEWNQENLSYSLAGYELEDDMHGLWIYLIAYPDGEPLELEVKNTSMLNVFPDQKNIVKFWTNDTRQSTLLLSKNQPVAHWSITK